MLKEILEYEKRLLEDREQLRKLIENSGGNASIEQDKLNFFKTELAYMNNQLELLKQKQGQPISSQAAQSAPVQPTQQMSVQNSHVMQQHATTPYSHAMQQQVPPRNAHVMQQQVPPKNAHVMQQQVPPQNGQTMQFQRQDNYAPPKRSEDLEKRFGKTVMGIVASVLIFISIILFATLLIPALNDTIKMAVTYIVSFVICGLGWFKLHRNRQDKFYLALTGCGMGALYISLLLSNMYFKRLGDIPLYALIAVWAVGICVLSRYNNLVFQIIGQTGIVISMIFGVILCAFNQDAGKFIVLILFYIVTSLVLYISHFKKRFNDNLCAHIANAINLFIILLGSIFIVDGGHYTYLIMLAFSLTHIVVGYLCTWTEKECAPGLIISLYGFVFVLNMIGFVKDENWCAVILYVFMMVLGAVAEFRKAGKDWSKSFVQVFAVVVAFIALCSVEMLMLHGMVPLLIAPLLAIGFWRSNKTLKNMALIISFYYVIFERDIHDVEWFITGAVLVAALYALVFLCKKQYSAVYKGFVHVLGIFFLLYVGSAAIGNFSISNDICYAISFVAAALFNIAIMKSPFAKNISTGEKEKEGLFNIINTLMMILGLSMIHMDLHILIHLLVVLVTLAIFMLNSKNLLDKYPNGFGGAYVGIKFTIFMLVLLSAHEATDYVLSIACFIFAVVSIVLGFGFKYKSLRVYGLVLCMISVFKLIVMDIEYADTLGYAISFFVAGVLCFGISLLYNFVDKRMKEKEEVSIPKE